MTAAETEAISAARRLLSKLSGHIEITDELRDEIKAAESALWDVLFPGSAAARRESGGSIPAECPCGEGKNPLHALLKSHESGGSRVKGE